ncbi:MAG: DUF4209 domain-containing protein [Sulfurovum sp.]|nr:DUF4209 domain-containing protein [Sulfurovum sp.]
MTEQRYNYELQVTIEDFTSSNYVEILKKASRDGYLGYWTILSKYAREEAEKGNENISKVLWLLSDACSMMLKPESLSEPFTPMVVMEGKRSSLPEDFSEEDIIFFESIVKECKNFKLQARIADILWLVKEKKNFEHLKIALNSYSRFSLTYDEILIGSREAFERAIRLSLATKQPLEDFHTILLSNFNKTTVDNNFHCLWINNLLYISKIESSHYGSIITRLNTFAKIFLSKNNWRMAREYFQAIREWYKKLNEQEKINQYTIAIAETFANKAKSSKGSQMAAGILFENAIQEYRLIPTQFREKLKINEKIDELYQKMSYANKLSLSEMSLIQTEGVDISEFVNKSIKAVQDKKLNDSIVILSNISTNPLFAKIKEEAESILRTYPLSSLFSSTHLSSDGRVVSKRSGLDFSDGESSSYLEALDTQISQQYNIHIELAAQAKIIPAFQQLIAEHRITKHYLGFLCSNSSIVPRNRVNMWVEGLYFGFEQNFLVSTHLLIPQIENLIRVLLKQIPVKTTILDDNGIEMEKGLSTLLKEKKLPEVVDENLISEFKILLSSQVGYNMRNNVAHGLSEGSFNFTETIYLWWLCLKLVVNNSTLINKKVENGGSND